MGFQEWLDLGISKGVTPSLSLSSAFSMGFSSGQFIYGQSHVLILGEILFPKRKLRYCNHTQEWMLGRQKEHRSTHTRGVGLE